MEQVKQLEAQMEEVKKGLEGLLKGNETSLVAEIYKDMEYMLSKFEMWKALETLKQQIAIPKRVSIAEEITNNLWEAIDFDKILVLHEDLFVTSFRKEDDAIFSNEKDWQGFVDKIDELGTYYLSEYLADERTVFDENKKIRVMFQQPIRVITDFEWVNGRKRHVFSEVTGIIIELDYEWYYSHSKEMATMLEVKGKIIGMK